MQENPTPQRSPFRNARFIPTCSMVNANILMISLSARMRLAGVCRICGIPLDGLYFARKSKKRGRANHPAEDAFQRGFILEHCLIVPCNSN